MSRVAVWGSYNHGNFGDDLMATLIARHLVATGMDVTLITQNPLLLGAEGSYRTSTLRGYDGDRLIIGGGAMLSSDTLLRFVASTAARTVEREFLELIRWIGATDGRAIAVSIGSDGVDRPNIWGARQKFFRNPAFEGGSVRLRSDVDLVANRFGRRVTYFPDILFSTGSGFRRAKLAADVLRVGVNINQRNARELVYELGRFPAGAFEVVPIITHSSFFEGHYEWGGGITGALVYQSIEEFLTSLASLDVVVSDKLHVGLVAATYGVPFLSYRGRGKTVAMHREFDLRSAVFSDPAEVAKAVYGLATGSRIRTLADVIRSEGLPDQSAHHLKLLDDWLREK